MLAGVEGQTSLEGPALTTSARSDALVLILKESPMGKNLKWPMGRLIAAAVAAGFFGDPAGARGALGGGETCPQATLIPALPFSDTGSTAGAVNDYDWPCPYLFSAAPDVVYRYTPQTTQTICVSLCGNTAYDSKVYIYEGSCSGLVLACNDDSCSTPSYPSPYVSEIRDVTLNAGTTYYIVVDGYMYSSGVYTLDLYMCYIPPFLAEIACCAYHCAPAGCTENYLCLDMPQDGRPDPPPIEPRRWQPGDAQTWRMTLTAPAGGAMFATADCSDGGAYPAASVVEDPPGVLTATWSPPLPNTECCTITLNGTAVGTADVRLLFGDVTRNGAVNSADKNLINAEIGTFANTSAVFWYDMDRNNAINTADKNLCTAQIGTGLHAGCP